MDDWQYGALLIETFKKNGLKRVGLKQSLDII